MLLPRGPLALSRAVLLAAIPVSTLRAQSAPAPERATHSVWLLYGGDHAVGRRLGVVLDAQLRLTQDAAREQQLLVRPGLSYSLAPRVKLASGYTVVAARDDGVDPLTPRRPEHRLWVLAHVAHDAGGLTLAHRVRTEHRWLSGVMLDEAGRRLGESWVTAGRMRYNLRLSVPLRTLGGGRQVSASLSEEVFASFGGYAGNLAVDQNRAAVALAVRLARVLRLEMGYLLQSSADDDGRMTQRNHVLQFGAYSTAGMR